MLDMMGKKGKKGSKVNQKRWMGVRCVEVGKEKGENWGEWEYGGDGWKKKEDKVEDRK
jgi:hypothetical protein